ncbi:hypothetical protein [Paenibacillus amylolyticus]|uniref:Phage tail tape measure protein n=1 Tax=Paenibacillus amylolyticus TaxID=1451 RepID=A0A100VTQ2_PAEAM|nr:hypothetical protein [Paenibacillus amylolyticus]GAS85649.1 unknown protein [Paenibacillus amylolyticus]
MSFDIVGHLRIIDNATRPLRNMSSGLLSFGASAAKAAGAVTGIGAAMAAINTADKFLSKTIKSAADFEMREVTLTAMFGKEAEQNVDKFMNYLGERADISQYSMDDFLDVGKSFVPTTKDLRQLERATNLAERLGAIDPEQGITGAAYALKEFFSGDAVSLVERFELPRSALNKIKNLPLNEQLDQLDKFLDKLGATNELIDAQSTTAMGQWRTAIGGVNRAFREMGTEALTSLKPVLAEFNAWLKGPQFAALKDWGVNAFGGLVNGAVNAVQKATAYLQDNFFNNEEFKALPDIEAKIKYVFDTLAADFQAWYDSSGSGIIKNMASKMVDTLGNALKASKPILDAATKIGVQVGASILEGIWSNAGIKEFFSVDMKSVANHKVSGTEALQIVQEFGGDKTPGGVKAGMAAVGFPAKGYSAGLARVPYNNYPARLHQDEMVLNSQQARDYRNGGGNSAPQITIYATIREDADIQKLARELSTVLAQ